MSETKNIIKKFLSPKGRLGRGKYFLSLVFLMFLTGILAMLGEFLISDERIKDYYLTVIGFNWLYLYIIQTIKRFHDFNMPGILIFLLIIPLVPFGIIFVSGTDGENKYGSR